MSFNRPVPARPGPDPDVRPSAVVLGEGGAVIDGSPAKQVGTIDAPPPRPGWALDVADLASIVRVERQVVSNPPSTGRTTPLM